MKYILSILLVIFLVTGNYIASGQDLDALLEQETGNSTDYALSTFMNNRIINGHSIEQMQKGGIDFRISHRFGSFNEGFNELYGLDESTSYFTADYGITNGIMVGIGRATFNKLVTGSLKAKLLRQSTGLKNMPVTVSLYGAVAATTQKFTNVELNNDFASRLEYTTQLLIARKFDDFSLQLSPTFVHRNLVETPEELNDLLALGISGRYKINTLLDLSAEYFWVNHSNRKTDKYFNPLAFALSYQVSHHVFQFIVTNSNPIAENTVIGKTTSSWLKGDIRIGFNISTVF